MLLKLTRKLHTKSGKTDDQGLHIWEDKEFIMYLNTDRIIEVSDIGSARQIIIDGEVFTVKESIDYIINHVNGIGVKDE